MLTMSRKIFSHPAPFLASDGPRELVGDRVVIGGGTAGEVIPGDHGVRDGRMQDGESEQASEEAARA